jgi:hypothetical protein
MGHKSHKHPNPPSNLDTKTEISRLWGIPDGGSGNHFPIDNSTPPAYMYQFRTPRLGSILKSKTWSFGPGQKFLALSWAIESVLSELNLLL